MPIADIVADVQRPAMRPPRRARASPCGTGARFDEAASRYRAGPRARARSGNAAIALTAQQQFLDLGREHVDAADDHHVVGAAGDLLHAPVRARRAGQEPRQIARAIADDRQAFLGQRGEDEFALLAIGQGLPLTGSITSG